MSASLTWPDTSSETLRLPLRAVVASNSAIRSSRSAQQSLPRSAACAEPAPGNAKASATANENGVKRFDGDMEPPGFLMVFAAQNTHNVVQCNNAAAVFLYGRFATGLCDSQKEN